MRKEILFVGFGGQGIKLLGEILGQAIVLEGNEATVSASYGAEARGSRCRSEVVVSQEKIDYPKTLAPDFLVVLSQDGYDFALELHESSQVVIFYDPKIVIPKKNSPYLHYSVPATEEANTLGKKIVANMVILGALVTKTKLVRPESVIKTLKKKVKKEFLELNLKAFEKGLNLK